MNAGNLERFPAFAFTKRPVAFPSVNEALSVLDACRMI